MPKVATTALRSTLADTINRAAYRGERFELERNGKVVAALISAEDLHLLENLETRMDLRAAASALKERRHKWDDVKAEIDA